MLSGMEQVKLGMRGAEVRFLQRMLNLHLKDADLREDGVFSARTHLALLRWQESQGAEEAGTLGIADGGVFASLGMRSSVEHWFQPYERKGDQSCWTAGLMMLLRSTFERRLGEDRAQKGMVWSLGHTQNNVRVFARQHRLKLLKDFPGADLPEFGKWLEWLRQGPLLAIGAASVGSNRWDHCCLIEGFYSDDNPDGTGTVFRIYDPWATRGEQSYGATYRGVHAATPHRKFSWEGVYLLGREQE